MSNPIKVLIVDDSPAIRQVMTAVLSSDPALTVIGAAADPYQAVEIMRQTAPDVITLDIEMPRMDGLTFLQRIMAQHPIPILICSSHATDGADATLRAFEFGAVDIITKPRVGTEEFLAESQIVICDAVKAAASVRRDRLASRNTTRRKLSADAVLAKGKAGAEVAATERMIVVGASTGGTQAIGVFLEALPADAPGVVIVQHMPENFTHSFARNLDSFCRMQVKEAADKDVVRPGVAYIAPGGKHTLVKRVGAQYLIEVRDGPLVSRHRPSVDVLFRSAARFAGANAVGVILTGMGDDGAQGMKELHDAGAVTFAQDEATSVVFGMPKEAIRLGGVDEVLPLENLPTAVLRARRK
jgi:two-component system, chemotaxis family, protein-glutamate methylesterase/glutaminase